MSDKIKCKTHGVQEAAYVCQHILESIHTGTPVGFHWPETSESARPDAWCHACEEARRQGSGEWTEELMEFVNIRLLCGACYDYARDIAFRGHKLKQ